VNVQPKNAAARAAGLMRVRPGQPDSSLLYDKLIFDDSHHSADLGSPMPLGGTPLTQGQVEFVRRWIAAGAPEQGPVADSALLLDRTPQTVSAFVPLAPPDQGFQLHLEPFVVAPNFERELFVHKRVGNTSDVYIDRIEMRMRLNSHHFVLYAFQDNTPQIFLPPYDQIRDLRRADGSLDLAAALPMAFHTFFAGAQTPNGAYQFPPGVALLLPANASLDLNSHYVNRTAANLTGEVYANLHTVPRSQVQRVAGTLFFNNTAIEIPARSRVTIRKTFTISDSVLTIFMLTSHMHARGERFVVRIAGGPRNGELVYATDSWQHPDIITYDTPIILRAGEGLTSEITYNNTTDRVIRFGLTSEDEMGIIFGYHYY
jgi:copper type II ascorbate-dependent monooxygenase-like protein